jgi:hypothetical protein
MKTLNKMIIILLILLVLVGTFFLTAKTTGNTIKDYYTYTKAICNENNFCQDHIITCNNKKVVNIKPITGASIQHSDSWEDPRKNKSEILCD